MATDGRHLWIHETLFDQWASRSDPATAEKIYTALASMALIKTFHDRVITEGVLMGKMRREKADILNATIANEPYKEITKLLQETKVWIKKRPKSEAHFLLATDEKIAGSCISEGYFTLATTPETADEMWREQTPVGEIRRKKHKNEGYHNWVFIDGTYDIGFDVPKGRVVEALNTPGDLESAKQNVRDNLKLKFRAAFDSADLNSEEKELADSVLVNTLDIFFSRKTGTSCSVSA